MYSIVLLTALSTGQQTPDVHFFACGEHYHVNFNCNGHRHHWNGCCCSGYVGLHGCGTSSCHGCCGYYGCSGAGYGGCYGYGYGELYHPSAGCWGTPYSCYGPAWDCYGGCGGTFAPAYNGVPAPVIAAPGASIMPAPKEEGKEEPKGKEDKPKDKPKDNGTSAERGRLEVQLPEGARLYVDDQLVDGTDTQRSFRTPILDPRQLYFYEVRVEVTQDGRPSSQTRRILIRSGQVSRADFRSVSSRTESVSTTSAR
jgi:uncharacterized protein (TIGR03000 family)